MPRLGTIAVTGGRGGFGTIVVSKLAARGYNVLSIDRVPAGEASVPHVTQLSADLTDYSQTASVLEGAEAVVHLAAIPDPKGFPPDVVFMNNTSSAFNVLQAASVHGCRKAVLASSESAYGFPWAGKPLSPLYLPVDEEHPLIPEDCYGLSKAVTESIGQAFHRSTGMQVVSLRLATICGEKQIAYLKSYANDPRGLRRILWSYVDARDAADACVRAVEKDGLGCVSLNIAADDTCSALPSLELINTYLPEVKDLRSPFRNNEALYSNRKAKRLLEWQPVSTWEDLQAREDGASGR
jgi:nucleoside-diphosphate-sugar epimerase